MRYYSSSAESNQNEALYGAKLFQVKPYKIAYFKPLHFQFFLHFEILFLLLRPDSWLSVISFIIYVQNIFLIQSSISKFFQL